MLTNIKYYFIFGKGTFFFENTQGFECFFHPKAIKDNIDNKDNNKISAAGNEISAALNY